MTEFAWPALPSGEVPVWTGKHFEVGGRKTPFLSYSENSAGWDDDLTSLHNRESAGGNHPIELTSRHNAVEGLKANLSKPITRILEIGSSGGFLLNDLRRAFPAAMIVGSDVAPGALAEIAREQPGTPLIQLDILACPLPAESFDAIVALNVLEHIEDDREALLQMARLLRPGGVILLEVPAGPLLYDAYDRQLHHFRRYRMSELTEKVAGAGLKLASKTHVGFLVYPAFAAVKLVNRLRSKSLEGKDVVAQSIRQSRQSPLLNWVFGVERRLFGTVSWPVGIRCLVIARKAS